MLHWVDQPSSEYIVTTSIEEQIYNNEKIQYIVNTS